MEALAMGARTGGGGRTGIGGSRSGRGREWLAEGEGVWVSREGDRE
ncbi:hypothetical protein TIFTF001_041727 [Ficus carica]|uniref:Uncharacterized protein n=1 Tax=Ficus carica TaxID=3494 RepID=A0AA87ZSQ7_FICCA|nr:hypothetical protein TIFTF001_041727 [Ficus carica]